MVAIAGRGIVGAEQDRDRVSDLDPVAIAAGRCEPFEADPEPLALLDRHGRHVAANAALCRLVGRPVTGVVGAPSARLVHPDDADALYALLGLQGDRRATLRLLRADGEAVPVSVTCSEIGGDGYVMISTRTVAGSPDRPTSGAAT